MYFLKATVMALLLIGVNCRYVHPPHSYYDTEESKTDQEDLFPPGSFRHLNLEDVDRFDKRDLKYLSASPRHLNLEDSISYGDLGNYHDNLRIRRNVQGVGSTNPDGSMNLGVKIPIAGNDKNVLSAVGSASGLKDTSFSTAGGGLALDNENGHGLSLTGTHVRSFGDQLTGSARVNLLNTPDHKINVNTFATRNMPNSDMHLPNYNTFGGNVDYSYKDRIGGSLGMAHTDHFKKTDYSAVGNLNLYKNPTSSLDFNAAFTKSVSPFISDSHWEPSLGLSFSKYW